MNVNKHIVVATLGLILVGAVKVWNPPKKTPPGHLTPVLLGGYVFMIVLSVIDLFGPQWSKLAGSFAMLALVTALFTELDWAQLFNAVRPQKV